MATYNRARLVGSAIQSVLSQTYGDYQLVVVDDGSTDDTRTIVSTFRDSIVRYISRENGGLPAARNTGIQHSTGEYIAFIDDDDLYLPDKLESQVSFMNAAPDVGWSSSGYRMIDDDGKLMETYLPWQRYPDLDLRTLLLWCPTCPSAVMVRKAWLMATGGFDEEIRIGPEDWDMWLRLAHAGCQLKWLPRVTCTYRYHRTSKTRMSNVRDFEAGATRVLDKFYAQRDISSDLLALRDAAYANVLLKRAAEAFGQGDPRTAMGYVDRAVGVDPSLLADGGGLVVDRLLGYSLSPSIDEPLVYASRVLDCLPEPSFAIRARRRKLLAQVAAGVFFRAAELGDHPLVRRALIGIVRNDASWLRNRGVIAIGLEALLGRGIMRTVRGLAHSIFVLAGGSPG